MLVIIFIIIITITNADIKVELLSFNRTIQLKYQGDYARKLTDYEISKFNISNENLKIGAAKYLGKKPDHIFLSNPTPWGDIFKKYKWKEVYTTIKIIKTEIKNTSFVPITIVTHEIVNNSSRIKIYDTDIMQKVKNTVQIQWNYDDLNEYSDFSVDFNIKFENTSLKFKNNLGDNSLKYINYYIGTQNSAKVRLAPTRSVKSKLHALKGYVLSEIDYEITLYGVVATNFAKKYGKHYFWSIPVDRVLSYANLTTGFKVKQLVQMTFYCDARLVTFDAGIKEAV